MTLLDFASDYFTSQPILETLGLMYALLAALFVVFKLEKRRPRARVRILFASFAVVISMWSFVAASLLICNAFLGLYQVNEDLAVGMVFGLAILASLVVALPLSAFVTYRVPEVVTGRLMRRLAEPEAVVTDIADRVAKSLSVRGLTVLQSPSGSAFAYSVEGSTNVVVVSKGLTARLDEEELETVVAHELAHLKNHDTLLNTILAVYRRVLFFDPFIRALQRATYGENEFSADELSARATEKPLSLASALLKISESQSGSSPSSERAEGVSILASGGSLKPPSVKERIERLISISGEFPHERVPAERALSVA